MFQQINDFYKKMLVNWVKDTQPMWFDFLRSEGFMKFGELMRTYYFAGKEEMDKIMEDFLGNVRVASKEDIDDVIDSQRVVLDMLDELSDKIKKLEGQLNSKKGAK